MPFDLCKDLVLNSSLLDLSATSLNLQFLRYYLVFLFSLCPPSSWIHKAHPLNRCQILGIPWYFLHSHSTPLLSSWIAYSRYLRVRPFVAGVAVTDVTGLLSVFRALLACRDTDILSDCAEQSCFLPHDSICVRDLIHDLFFRLTFRYHTSRQTKCVASLSCRKHNLTHKKYLVLRNVF